MLRSSITTKKNPIFATCLRLLKVFLATLFLKKKMVTKGIFSYLKQLAKCDFFLVYLIFHERSPLFCSHP
jgi:hypothetical protein